MNQRDNFTTKIVETLAKRASFICSNPDCRCLTIAASNADQTKVISIGIAAHITAASVGGPRYDSSMSQHERSDISNGIFLCGNCSLKIDKNNGVDFTVAQLFEWKKQHEQWIKENLNKSIENSIVEVNGTHHAAGVGNITGLHITRSAIIQPGTVVTAQGFGNVTGTKIGS